MGLFQQIRSWFLIDDAPAANVEKRAAEGMPVYNDGWVGMGEYGYSSKAGVPVSRTSALSVPAIWAAVDTICKALASLPFGIFQQTEQGSRPAKAHPLYHLIRINPTPDLELYSAYTFKYAFFADACFGDAFAKIHRNGIGRPTNLELLDASDVTMYQRDDGRPYYVVRRTVGTRFIDEILFPSDILHIKGLTINGLRGEDVTRVHADSIGMSIAAEQYGGYFFGNGASPSGALIYPNAVTPQNRDMAQSKFAKKYGGVANTGQTIVLDGGAKYERISLSPEEATLNDTRNFQVNQASRIFGVPVPLLAQLDKATLNNMETMGIQFVTMCLRPWAVQVEQEFALKLLTSTEQRSENYFFRFNFNGLLRGATKERGEYYKQGLGGPSTGIGWLSVNEVRELENLDRVPDGDSVFTAEMVMQAQKQQNGQVEEPKTDETQGETSNDNGTPQASK